MLRSILIGLDGSTDSDRAIELGIQWASKLKLRLIGLAIVDEPAICRPEPVPIGAGVYRSESVQGLLDNAHCKVKQVLDQFEACCIEAGVDYILQEDVGEPSDKILLESQRCDMILLGHETHFRFHTEHRADRTQGSVLKNAPRPVVVVPPILQKGSSVVVAYDGSPSADRALQAFQTSGLGMGERVYVVAVEADRQEATCYAEHAVEFLRLHDIVAETISREPTVSVATMILEEVRQKNSRLLVMGAYGHSKLREFFMGSLTDAVLQESPVPVLLCH